MMSIIISMTRTVRTNGSWGSCSTTKSKPVRTSPISTWTGLGRPRQTSCGGTVPIRLSHSSIVSNSSSNSRRESGLVGVVLASCSISVHTCLGVSCSRYNLNVDVKFFGRYEPDVQLSRWKCMFSLTRQRQREV